METESHVVLSSSWNWFLVRIDSCLVAIVRPNLSTSLCSSPTYTQTLHDLHIRFGSVFTLEREREYPCPSEKVCVVFDSCEVFLFI